MKTDIYGTVRCGKEELPIPSGDKKFFSSA
jgi:hypothetical protein